MAAATKDTTPATEQASAGPKRYFIVNPKGAIHQVEKEHARTRLRQVGYRMATKEEIAALDEQNGNQVHDKPITRPWSDDPDVEIDL